MNWYKKAQFKKKDERITFCQHCQEVYPVFRCKECKRSIRGECRDCHMELHHDTISLSPVEFFPRKGFENLAPRQREKII
jgi:hypothetical protein